MNTSKNGTSDDEACLGCPTLGACCFYGARVCGKDIMTDHHCPLLDTETGLCMDYKNRRKVRGKECLTVEEMIEQGTVPRWCVYVKDDKEYQERVNTRLYKFDIAPVQPGKLLSAFYLVTKQYKDGPKNTIEFHDKINSAEDDKNEVIKTYNIFIRIINKAKKKIRESAEVKDREKPKRVKRRILSAAQQRRRKR